MEDAFQAELSKLRPRRKWASATGPGVPSPWQRTEDSWDLPAPPEDYALPPALPWTERLRNLALRAYNERFEKYLDPGQRYEMDWPPEGSLSNPGAWYVETPSCPVHGEDLDDSCPECETADAKPVVVIDRPASWEWNVGIRLVTRETLPDGSSQEQEEDEDPWLLGFTDVDPREVEYGPEKDTGERADLVRAFWQADQAEQTKLASAQRQETVAREETLPAAAQVAAPRTAVRSSEAPWQDFDLVMRAAAYAADAHRNDLRKATTIPYLSHLWSVAALVLEYGGDDEQVAAALLHDVAEDHGGAARIADIAERFGPEVARLIEALSDSLADTDAGDVKAPWPERKQQYLAHLVDVDERVALVSACDKLHNARAIEADLRTDGLAMWQRFTVTDPAAHLWYYGSLLTALQSKVPEPLADALRRTVSAMESLAFADPSEGRSMAR